MTRNQAIILVLLLTVLPIGLAATPMPILWKGLIWVAALCVFLWAAYQDHLKS